ncbi:TPA: hypothetical protein DCG82_00385, partial [candidate division WOR-3]|nr:hypothetical protein [candidate division WOR-3 bacterium]
MKNLIVNRTNIIKFIIFLNLIISSIFILILIKQIDSVKRKEEKTLFNTLEHHKEYVKVKMKTLNKSLKFISYLYTVNDFLKYSKNKEVKDRFFNKVKEIHDAYNEVNSISLIDRNGNLIFFENGCSVDTNLLMNSTLNKEIKFSKIKIFGKKPFFDAYIPVFDKKNGDFIGTIIL